MPGVSKAQPVKLEPVKLEPTVVRCCLKCNRGFNSVSKTNRLCNDCNADNIKLSSLAGGGARIMHEYGGRNNNSYMYDVGGSD